MTAPEDRDSWVDVLGGFPRHLVHSLVEESDERAHRRRTAAAWVLGAAICAFALAAPLEALAGRGPSLVRAALANELGASPLLLLAYRALSPSVGIERAAFLLSAVAAGLTVPALLAVARRFGFPAGLALPGGLVVALSPGALAAARLPGPEAPALLAATLLLAGLFPSQPGAAGPGARGVGLRLGFALAVDLGSLWLAPAVLWATARAGRRRVARAVAFALLPPAALCALAAALGASLPGGGLGALAAQALLGADFPAEGAPLSALALDGPLALGPSLLGLAALAFLRRGEEESPPPRFLVAWALLPLVASASPRPAPVAPLALLPLALVGLLDLLARLSERQAVRLALTLAGLSLALAAAAGLGLERADPMRPWREAAERELSADDLVVSADPLRRHLLVARYRLEALAPDAGDLEERAEAARDAGRRIVVDVAGAEGEVLQRLRRLEERGATRLRAP